MKKLSTLFIIFILSSFCLKAQLSTIRAMVLDESNNQPLPGAMVEITPAADTTKKKYYSTTTTGAVTIQDVAYDTYRFKIYYMGYAQYVRNVKVDQPATNLRNILLKPQAINLSAIKAVGTAMRTTQLGDTLVYNADAFKVTKDASSESLLAKMPGIKIVDGQVETQGETVKKVFVDGKEFFGDDVNAALKSMPAEVVAKIEVFNKLSDQAEFSGVEDGETYKAINIVTNVPMTSAQFGRIYAGYGFDDKYIAGANVNVFKGNARFALLSLFNNINQQNFSTEDIVGAMSSGSGSGSRQGGYMRRRGSGNMMVTPQAGISRIASVGLNYSDKWGKKATVEASYFFNNSKNENDRVSETNYYTGNYEKSNANSESRNWQHRLNGRVNYRINQKNELTIRPSLSFQDYTSGSTSQMFSREADDILTQILDSRNNSDRYGYNLRTNIVYRHRLGKPGRIITFDASGSLSKNDREATSYNVRPLGRNYADSTISLTNGYTLYGRAMYTEPLSKYSNLNFSYQANYSYSDADRKVYLYDYAMQEFDSDYSTTQSNISNSGYLTQRIGPGFSRREKRNSINVNLNYQHSSLTNDREYPTPAYDMKKTFDNFVYFAMVNQTFEGGHSIRFNARSSTTNPSVTQLQDVAQRSGNTVSVGDRNLIPAYSNRFFLNYVRTNTAKGRTFTLRTGYEATSNAITSTTRILNEGQTIDFPNGITATAGDKVTSYLNMDGDWSVLLNASFGLPVKWLLSNVNFNAAATYNESPGLLDGLRNITASQYYNAGVDIGSNISEKIDFRVSYNGGYNIVRNSRHLSGSSGDDYEYFSHYISGNFKWIAWKGFTLFGNASWYEEKGITDNYYNDYLICNLYLGKKIFRNQRGEISFGVNDLFDQYKSFSRNVTNDAIETVNNTALGRYYMVQFVYNLRTYGKKKMGNSASTSSGDALPAREFRAPGENSGGSRPGGGGFGAPGGGGFGPPSGGGPM